MPEPMLSSDNYRDQPESRTGKVLSLVLGGLGIAVFVGIAAYFIIEEEKKYDAVYSRLGIERFPKTVENMPYIQVELAKLVANACDRQRVNGLASSLNDIGQSGLSKVVRDGYVASCLRNAPTATTSSDALDRIVATTADAEARRLALQVQQNLCNQPAVTKLIGVLQRATDHHPVTLIGEAFLANCSQDIMVGYWMMQSYYYLGNYLRSLAVIEAFQQVEPNDPYWPYWRGRNLDKMRRYFEAGDAYLRALSLWPKPATVVLDDYWRAYGALKNAGRFCEALDTLKRYVDYDPTTRSTPQMQAALTELRGPGACPWPAR